MRTATIILGWLVQISALFAAVVALVHHDVDRFLLCLILLFVVAVGNSVEAMRHEHRR